MRIDRGRREMDIGDDFPDNIETCDEFSGVKRRKLTLEKPQDQADFKNYYLLCYHAMRGRGTFSFVVTLRASSPLWVLHFYQLFDHGGYEENHIGKFKTEKLAKCG